MHSDGATRRGLTAIRPETEAAWSPDGTRCHVHQQSRQCAARSRATSGSWTDGTKPVRLTASPGHRCRLGLAAAHRRNDSTCCQAFSIAA